MPSLFVIRGNDQGCRFELEPGQWGIGRDAANLVRLRDTEVSRRHAQLEVADRQCRLVDLESSNGTFVNGRRVSQHLLQSGDQLQLGRTLLLYTGPGDQQQLDLGQQIEFVASQPAQTSARIVRAISHEEGSRIFQFDEASPPSHWLARARGNLQLMYRTALAVSQTLDIDQLLNRLLDFIFEWVDADRGCVMLLDPHTQQLSPAARRDRAGRATAEKIIISQTILDYVRQHREGVLTSDARDDERWQAGGSILQHDVHEALCVPMQGRYDVVGIIYIDTHTPAHQQLATAAGPKFHEEHLKLLIAIAHQAALAVEDTRYYSAMVQAERLAAVGQTIAMLSHHVKNILQGIRGGGYLVEMGLEQGDDELIRKGWGMVQKRQDQISHLVLDMLTFSKEREPEFVMGQLNQTVADVVELMQPRAAELGVDLHWHPATDLPELAFDPDALHRAILNVVTNALDACHEQPAGRVDVSTQWVAAAATGNTASADASSSDAAPPRDASSASAAASREVSSSPATPPVPHARIVVADNGSGIPADELDRIFSLFVSSKGSRGTGLGLPVSQKILREHGGNIRVTSSPGQGTCFTLELPCQHFDPHAADADDAADPLSLSATLTPQTKAQLTPPAAEEKLSDSSRLSDSVTFRR